MKNRYLSMVLLGTMGLCVNSAYASSTTLQSMSDSELSATTGQALMSLSYIAPTDNANLMKNIAGSNNIGFYKLGMEAKVELNANIKNLQLGCGGMNGAANCDIDIKNLSLSGLPDSYDANGSPIFNSRASTDATITNPFIQFAIQNPNSASTRQVVGLQLGAAAISGLLTAGTNNSATPSTTDGIQSLSGFMQIASTTGTAVTQAATFGKGASNQSLSGYANISGLGNASFVSDPSNSKTTGITIPSMTVPFTLPSFSINGVRQTQANVQNIMANIPIIPIAPQTGCSGNITGTNLACGSGNTTWGNDQLYVDLGCNAPGSGLCGLITAAVPNTIFKMANNSSITNLKMNITFNQALSMIHNIPLTGTGGYLSLQNQQLLWPGATVATSDQGINNLNAMSSGTDVAQPGWWMSFAEPVQLGKLNVTNPVDISSVLPQVAKMASDQLKTSPYTYVSFGSAIGALTGAPIVQQINIDLGAYTTTNPATLTLQNQQLNNQKVVSNCYGSLSFC
ncbi:hypothetical protein F895_00816 [Acinetobacter sp. CIP 64.2]|uniref:hypothetical protein n=1 Tax=Acinetobacter TaxID=469 RepID=UPI0002CDB631|nr:MULTISPECIES: hypothetical protein [Acinetobacter]ENX17672.1 hypothetical protein F895_00816 [Acinetobacter sp. CIP 64.2]UUM27502.1 hypothetical protein NQU59_18030 [Acinetobacter colistiniresistens]